MLKHRSIFNRRSALKSAGIAAIVAGLLGPGGIEAAPESPIERAETLLLELRDILLTMNADDRLDVGVNLEALSCLGTVHDDRLSQTSTERPLLVGAGNRWSDCLAREGEVSTAI